ncbi:MAG TPA: xanthine dehydrogenase family protein molybdopterin-binding subunit [Syntrophomonadaceae bacterium]|nr:xanthine dehydrogenase family protein molybdopterin-binding subunit [Syntrophomonadaceae bacterium]HNX29174.1 xanthine dehydrogenase family protein molybdopterin-binding subunit [Syntrophomonadaceae bacterium]HPR93653.1 xanthine dehydrogenase family protein molybdopterin-binding subunit [Syntrophomonadaceae bacterium]
MDKKEVVMTEEILESLKQWTEKKDSYDVIGTKTTRIDAKSKATGKAMYVEDVMLPGMLHAKILRSPYCHARIINIDTSEAEKLPGVKAVLTGKDVPQVYMAAIECRDEPLLAWDGKVRFIGQEVAAVAATEKKIAEEALSLIKVDYEELPGVLNADDSIKDGAPQIHDGILTYEGWPDGELVPGKVKNNIAYHAAYDRGDPDQGFSEADAIVEQEFFYKHVVAAYMEPDGCVADYHAGEEKITLYVTTQWPANIKDNIMRNLGFPQNKVRVIQNAAGGAFGSKFMANQLHHISALLSMKTGKPVKLIRTRTEDFELVRSRGDMKLWMKLGVKKDGTITAEQTKILMDNGAYQFLGRRRSLHQLERSDATYRFKNVRHDIKNVYTNKNTTGCYRSFGDAQMAWAREILIDMLAEKINMDPAEIRLKNAMQTGDVTVNGWHIKSCGLTECINKATEAINWDEKRKNKRFKRGVGIACTCHETDDRSTEGFGGSVSLIKLLEDGGAQLLAGEAEYGNGAYNAFAMVISEELGIPADMIDVVAHDTDRVPWGQGATGSRVMAQGVNATYLACQDVIKKVINAASDMLKVKPEELEFKRGKIYVISSPDKSISLAEVAEYAIRKRGGSMIIGEGVDERWDTELILKITHPTHYGRGVDSTYYDTVTVEVEVDTETGEVHLLNVVVADDCGKVIDRRQLEGQVDGATVQGIGAALFEEIIWDDKGQIANPNYTDYKVPLAHNVPPIQRIFVESIEPVFAYGCKGGGESPGIGSIVPAISNAIYDAVGVRITSTPMSKEKVLLALKEKEGKRI